MNKLKRFAIDKKTYLIAVGVIFFAVIIAFACTGIFPCGMKSFAHYDAGAQIAPMTTLIFDWFEGKSNLFYSTTFAGGANTFAGLLYFIISPFNLILLMGGRGGISYAMSFLFLIKVIVIAIVFCWFVRKYFKNIKDVYVIILSIFYAFCGYCLMMYTYITWLDFLIYMPILAHLFMQFIKSKKILWLSVMLSLFMYTCFALGSFSMILFMILFGLYTIICVDKVDRKVVLTRLIFAFLIAICLTAVLLVPCFLQYLSSGRKTKLFRWLFKNNLLSYLPQKLLYFLTNGLFLMGAIAFVITCDKKDRINKFLMYSMLVMMIPIIIDGSNMLLNGGSYFSYSLRFGFIRDFLLFVMVARLIDTKAQFFEGQSDGIVYKKSYVTDLSILCGVVSAICIIALVCTYPLISINFANNCRRWDITLLYLLIILIVMVAVICLSLARKHNNISSKFFKITISVLLTVMLGFNLSTFVVGNPMDIQDIKQTAVLTEELDRDIRVKDFSCFMNENSNLQIEQSSLSGFSSLIDAKVVDLTSKLGYASLSNSVSSYGGTLLSDCMCGYDYYLSDITIDRPYLTLVAEEEGYYLYKNEYSFGRAYVVSEALLDIRYTTMFAYQQRLFDALGGTGTLVESINMDHDIEYEFTNAEIIEIDGKEYFHSTGKESSVTLKYTVLGNKIVYNSVVDRILGNFLQNISVEYQSDIYNSQMPQFYDLGYYTDGEQIEINLSIEKDVPVEAFDMFTFNVDRFGAIVPSMQQSVDIDINKNVLSFETTNNTDGFLVMTYSNIDGYNAVLNGEGIDTSEAMNGFIACKVEAGDNTVVLTYHNKYIKIALIALCIGIAMAVLLLIFVKFGDKIIKKVESIGYWAYIVVCVGLIGFFFVFPTGVSIYRLIAMIF